MLSSLLHARNGSGVQGSGALVGSSQNNSIAVAQDSRSRCRAAVDQRHLHIPRGYGEVAHQLFHRRTPREMNVHTSLGLAIARQCASQRYLDLHEITSSRYAFGQTKGVGTARCGPQA